MCAGIELEKDYKEPWPLYLCENFIFRSTSKYIYIYIYMYYFINKIA